MNIREETLGVWANGPSQTESDKCDNAVRAVRRAIRSSSEFDGLDIEVFAQGSYAARTNVRLDSDVDVCVCCRSIFFADYSLYCSQRDAGNTTADLSYSEFKRMVGRALFDFFPPNTVVHGNKAFDVHENTNRVDADVIPTIGYRYYHNPTQFDMGVAFEANGSRVINWPEQTYQNGVHRNNDTGRAYKRTIRILKRLRNTMQEQYILGAHNVASFLIECLVWNADADAFEFHSYRETLQYLLADLCNKTRFDHRCHQWREVNDMKWLFSQEQPWTRQKANSFLNAAWDVMGYE